MGYCSHSDEADLPGGDNPTNAIRGGGLVLARGYDQDRLNSIAKQFASVQKRAANLISGTFKTTAAAELDVQLFLLPMRLYMERQAHETALRIRTGPLHAVPEGMIRQRPKAQVRSGWTPMEAQVWKKGGCLWAPRDTLARAWESREAYIREPWEALPSVIIEGREGARSMHDSVVKSTITDAENQPAKPLIIYTDGSVYMGQWAQQR